MIFTTEEKNKLDENIMAIVSYLETEIAPRIVSSEIEYCDVENKGLKVRKEPVIVNDMGTEFKSENSDTIKTCVFLAGSGTYPVLLCGYETKYDICKNWANLKIALNSALENRKQITKTIMDFVV